MTTISSFLQERILLMDGGMGTQILARRPSVDDFGGPAHEGCLEILNERRPDWIREIHAAYFAAGADAVETNTFGCNELMLAEYGLAHRTEELNVQGARVAREAAINFAGPRFVVGSVGPGSKLLSLGHVEYDVMLRSYLAQVRGLLRGGVDALLIETSQDLGQIKVAIRAAKLAMEELKIQRPLWVQATVENSGTLLLGTELQAVITVVEALGVDLLGLNCGLGPDEMHAALATLAESSPFPISCQPNAGLPVNREGSLVYLLEPDPFADKLVVLAKEFHLNVLGGCCGTTPAHIRALKTRSESIVVTHRVIRASRSVASLYQSVALHQEPRPLIVGERTNANGSKAFRNHLSSGDYDNLVSIAKEQQREGAHMLDVCVAFAGRDEVFDMEQVLKRMVLQVTAPLMVDSTDPEVLERALKTIPGKAVVNSIHFEDGESKARKILDLCRSYGAAVVGLTIDEDGMARSVERKLAIAERLYQLVVKGYGFNASDLIIDPLTFTLAAGDEESRRSAVESLEAVRLIKDRYHGVLTLLGLSNASFGLKPKARRVLNAVLLYHAVKAGLDLAIFNAAGLLPLSAIPENQRQAAEDLIFNRRSEMGDPLTNFLSLFEGEDTQDSIKYETLLSAQECLRRDILRGDQGKATQDAEAALKTMDPLQVLNEVLLPAMKAVGEAFGAGELQLPFVLQSAEAMKAAVRILEPRMAKGEGQTKGRILLATVKGDVHDIGKNLVNVVLTNNGFEVDDLGIKQPIEHILATLAERPADALGLSGLLVKSVQTMKENLVYMAERGLRIPVILGGAALTRNFVERECRPVYPGPVLYAADAFEGLSCMEAIVSGALAEPGAPRIPGRSSTTTLHAGEPALELDARGQSPWVRRDLPAPQPPFWGVRELQPSLVELFAFLDDFATIRHRWSFTQGRLSDEAFAAILQEKAEPLLKDWKTRLLTESTLRPRARYGYFPCAAEANCLNVFSPDGKRLLAKLCFPRQASGRRLCIADFFEPDAVRGGPPARSARDVPPGSPHMEIGPSPISMSAVPEPHDVLPLQLVTLGPEAVDRAAELYASGRFMDYFLFHGLATELTEAFAELVHAKIRSELGIQDRDTKMKQGALDQRYQGSRFSFGYPACPKLEDNGVILELLQGETLGVTLTENCQMVPEYTTAALIAWHPQARCFAV